MKIALITGASSGIGRDFVKQIAKSEKGIDEIWAVARRKERLEQLTNLEITVRPIALDLLDLESTKKLEQMILQENATIEILVNSAGFGKIGLFENVGLQDNEQMVMLNCASLTSITRMAIPYLNKGSRVIQIASSAAFLPQPKFSVYAATKSYVLSLTRAIHRELKPKGIVVTAVCPGPVETEFFDVAETTGKLPLYKKLVRLESEQVVERALKASRKHREIVTCSAIMKAFRIVTKIFPHKLILKFF